MNKDKGALRDENKISLLSQLMIHAFHHSYSYHVFIQNASLMFYSSTGTHVGGFLKQIFKVEFLELVEILIRFRVYAL